MFDFEKYLTLVVDSGLLFFAADERQYDYIMQRMEMIGCMQVDMNTCLGGLNTCVDSSASHNLMNCMLLSSLLFFMVPDC